ncbi:MAG: hypothetical protein Q7U74_06680 [Saprospiraceae bacterium]|nr:hypothetical protein [Saprospiraceae bacterium]
MVNTKMQKRNLRTEPKLLRTQILLDPTQHKQLAELAEQEKTSMSNVVRKMLDEAFRVQKRRSLEQAAEWMAQFYQTDPELRAFSALDGEDFLG